MSGPSVVSAYVRALVERMIAMDARRDDVEARYAVSAREVVRELRGDGGNGATAEVETRVAAAWSDLAQHLTDNPAQPLARVAHALDLEKLDIQLLCASAAPEFEPALERLYAFAWNDFTRKRPDVGFLVRLVAGGDAALELRAFDRLDERRPLRRHRVLVIGAGDVPWTARPVRVADRIVAELRGLDAIDDGVARYVRSVGAPTAAGMPTVDAPTAVILPDAIADQIRRALADDRARVVLAGRPGTGRALFAAAVARERGMASLRVALAALLDDPAAIVDRATRCLREAALRNALCIFDGDDIGELAPAARTALALALAGSRAPAVFTLPRLGELDDVVEIEVPPPTFGARVQLWQAALPADVTYDAGELETIAGRYAFTGGTIVRAARRAVASARLRDPRRPRVTLDELGDAARLAFSHRLGDVAQRIPAGFSWDDLVVPDETLAQIREVVAFAHERPFLLEAWGFAKKLPYGRGVSAILAGPPGTGKTMVAQLLAKELGYDLFRIDLSQVVNKYVGETEKNLARIFVEAEHSHAILFFDEADALFSRRTDVQSSNDRYANLEVNYLLQRMETYDGVTLLATNLEQGLDEAFKRRVRFAIQFELPDVDERERLWRSMIPGEVPLADDVDWRELAAFEMAGGYIKKAVLRAALLASVARPRRAIAHADLVEAAHREYREMGRVMHGLA